VKNVEKRVSKQLFAASPENCFFAKRLLPPDPVNKSFTIKSTNPT